PGRSLFATASRPRPCDRQLSGRTYCSLGRVNGPSEMRVSARLLDLLLLRLDVDAIQSSRIETEYLLLRLERQNRPGLLRLLFRNFEGHEFVDQPLRSPDAIVAAVQELVWPNPEEQFGHNVAEIARTGVNERQRDRKAAIDVGFLRGNPAEIVKARQAA